MNRGTKFIARTGIIAALYFILTFAVAPIAYGPLQFRIGEALTLLPLLFPEAILGLTIGCFAANMLSPFSWADIVFGTLATLVAALMTYGIGQLMKNKSIILRCIIGALPPILINAIALPAMWFFLGSDTAYWINLAMMLGTQSGTVLLIGMPLTISLSKTKIGK